MILRSWRFLGTTDTRFWKHAFGAAHREDACDEMRQLRTRYAMGRRTVPGRSRFGRAPQMDRERHRSALSHLAESVKVAPAHRQHVRAAFQVNGGRPVL